MQGERSNEEKLQLEARIKVKLKCKQNGAKSLKLESTLCDQDIGPRTTTERRRVFILQRSIKHESVVFTRIFLNVEIMKVHFLIHTLAPKLHTQH